MFFQKGFVQGLGAKLDSTLLDQFYVFVELPWKASWETSIDCSKSASERKCSMKLLILVEEISSEFQRKDSEMYFYSMLRLIWIGKKVHRSAPWNLIFQPPNFLRARSCLLRWWGKIRWGGGNRGKFFDHLWTSCANIFGSPWSTFTVAETSKLLW